MKFSAEINTTGVGAKDRYAPPTQVVNTGYVTGATGLAVTSTDQGSQRVSLSRRITGISLLLTGE